MSIFNFTNDRRQINNIDGKTFKEERNRIVNMWNFMISFDNYFLFSDTKPFTYNVKSVTLPKYSMKTYKRYYKGAERSFPIRRVCDGTFDVVFYGREDVINVLNDVATNVCTDSNVNLNLNNYSITYGTTARGYETILDTLSIDVIQLPNTLENSNWIKYTFVKPVLVSIEYNALNVESNSLLEITCTFQYQDFRITSDSTFKSYGGRINYGFDDSSVNVGYSFNPEGNVDPGNIKIVNK